MLDCVWGAASDVDLLSDCTTLDSDGALSIDLDYGLWSFGGTTQLPVNVLVSDKYLVTNLIVMGDPWTILLVVVLINIPLFSKPGFLPIRYKFHIQEHISTKH